MCSNDLGNKKGRSHHRSMNKHMAKTKSAPSRMEFIRLLKNGYIVNGNQWNEN